MTTLHCYLDGATTPQEVPLEDLKQALEGVGSAWLDIPEPQDDTLHQLVDVIPELGGLDLARLSRVGRPPRVKVMDDVLLTRMYAVNYRDGELASTEVQAIATPTLLLTLRHGPAHDLSMVAKRWARQPNRHTEGGPYLLWLLIDEVVDDYFTVIDAFEAGADEVEDRVFSSEPRAGESRKQREAVQREIYQMRSDVARFRRQVIPYGEVRELQAAPGTSVGTELGMQVRDAADAVLRAIELIDNVRDQLTSAFEAELAQVSNELNETMKKLSSWAAILLVPTLIAGIYGMNFENMPELQFANGYFGALALMGGVSLTLYLVFKRKRWL